MESNDPVESILNSIANLTISVKALLKMVESLTESLEIVAGRVTLLEGLYEQDK